MKIDFEGSNLGNMFENIFGVSPSVVVRYGFVTCCSCGTPFALESNLLQALQENGRTFYCPNGHPQSFGEGTIGRLKKELAQEAKEKERLETEARFAKSEAKRQADARAATERSLKATKGVVTRLKNRAANGVCPCCSRHFTDLERHMKSRHPDFQEAEAEEEERWERRVS